MLTRIFFDFVSFVSQQVGFHLGFLSKRFAAQVAQMTTLIGMRSDVRLEYTQLTKSLAARHAPTFKNLNKFPVIR